MVGGKGGEKQQNRTRMISIQRFNFMHTHTYPNKMAEEKEEN